jgi:FKBP-type peptidyl-prolyl cis-trans isomerase FklB
MDEAIEKIEAAFAAAQAEIGERNRDVGEAFLAENGKRPEVIVTPSGLQYELVSEGAGEMPGPADVVLVHYRGATIRGEVFDSTWENGQPIEIPLNRVIPGWAEGLRMMREGGKAKLYIPPNLAYGERGAGGLIGPNSVLVFDVELLSIVE